MLHENERDKDLQRNQLIAMLLMAGLVMVYFTYFMPVQEQQPAPECSSGQTDEGPGTMRGGPGPRAGAQEAIPVMPAVSGIPLPELDLTAAPEPAEPVILVDEDLRVALTPYGARLMGATVLLDRQGIDDIELVPQPQGKDPREAFYPLGLTFSDPALSSELNRRKWEVVEADERSATFAITLPDFARLTKTISLTDRPHVLAVQVEYEHLADSARMFGIDYTPAYFLQWGPRVETQDENKGIQKAVIWRTKGEVQNLQTSEMQPEDGRVFQRIWPELDWLGVRSAYFLVAMRAGFERGQGHAAGSDQHYFFGLGVPPFEAQPGETYRHAFEVYAGPSQQQELAQAWPTLAEGLRFFDWFGFMDTFAKFLLALLHWMYNNIYPSYGVAIILLTALVRIVVFPLALPQMRSMKKMQLLQPEMEKLKEEHGDDQQALGRATMELFQERGVNPLGGCLPLVMQFPVFIALYRMLWNAFELRGADFLWIDDLSEADRLLHIPALAGVPFIGEHIQYLNILPILAGAAMLISMKLTPTTSAQVNPQQKTIMYLMPVMMSVLFYSWASGLNLYVLTSTVLGIAQSWVVRHIDFDVDIEKKKTAPSSAGKHKHFYDKVLAKKKEAEKELKREQAAARRAKRDPKAEGSPNGGAKPKRRKSAKKK